MTLHNDLVQQKFIVSIPVWTLWTNLATIGLIVVLLIVAVVYNTAAHSRVEAVYQKGAARALREEGPFRIQAQFFFTKDGSIDTTRIEQDTSQLLEDFYEDLAEQLGSFTPSPTQFVDQQVVQVEKV